MEVVNPRAALLSNFEVLSLLRELEDEQLAETRTALAVKKEQAENGQTDMISLSHQPPVPEVCENLRTVEFEAIAHLSAPYQPAVRQTAQSIQKLTKSLAPYGLTKGEKLQIVNLAPTQPVELYVIVEELEDRLNSQMDDILSLVRESLDDVRDTVNSAAPPTAVVVEELKDEDASGEVIEEVDYVEEGWDNSGMLDLIDAEGDFEGDLDAEEDEE